MSISLNSTQTMLTWLAPAAFIPALRYFHDPVPQRKALFVRDASTLTIGAALFLLTQHGLDKAFAKTSLFKTPEIRRFAAFLLALGANILFAGIGALKISQRLFKPQENSRQAPTQLSLQPVRLPQPAFSTYA